MSKKAEQKPEDKTVHVTTSLEFAEKWRDVARYILKPEENSHGFHLVFNYAEDAYRDWFSFDILEGRRSGWRFCFLKHFAIAYVKSDVDFDHAHHAFSAALLAEMLDHVTIHIPKGEDGDDEK